MTEGRLLAHYDRIADAPDAVTRLRAFVLDLAVRGKLVPQDPGDEPASELLNCIAAERAHLVKATKTDQASRESTRGQTGAPFGLPSSWMWARLGEICTKTGSGSTPRGGKQVYQDSGVPFLRSQNVYNERLQLDGVAYVDEKTHAAMEGTHVVPGDLLLNITGGSIGRCCIVPSSLPKANVSQHVAIIRVAIAGLRPFVHKLILSPYFQSFVIDEQTGAGRGGLPKNRMDRLPVALPPLAEQRRIVAKLDELMALCDRLERTRVGREAIRDRFAAAILVRLNAPDSDTFWDDARFALNVLPALTARPNQIRELRQTLITLAVRGELVPQDPSDESASELLRRISNEKVELVKTGKTGKAEPVADLTPTDHGLCLPQGWALTNLQSLCTSVTDGDHLPPPKAEGGIPFLVIGNVRSGRIDFTGSRFVAPEYYEALDPIRRPKMGDLLYTLVGSYGIPVMVRDDQPFCVQRHIGILRPSEAIDANFLARAMESRFVFDQATACATGIAQKTVPLFGLRRLSILLPPLNEQHRIVSKVDALLALCDRLEASLATGDETRRRLLSALLAEAMGRDDRGSD